MISETRLIQMMSEKLDERTSGSYGNDLASKWSEGYGECYNDVITCIEQLAEERRIKASARRAVLREFGVRG